MAGIHVLCKVNSLKLSEGSFPLFLHCTLLISEDYEYHVFDTFCLSCSKFEQNPNFQTRWLILRANSCSQGPSTIANRARISLWPSTFTTTYNKEISDILKSSEEFSEGNKTESDEGTKKLTESEVCDLVALIIICIHQSGLWRRTSHCVSWTVSFPTQFVITGKLNNTLSCW